MGFFDKSSKKKISNSLSDESATVLFARETTAGAVVTPKTAMQMTAVYSCVRILSEAIASLPFQLYETSKDGKQKAVEHPLYKLLHDSPNPEMTSFVWREKMMADLLLYGNSYNQIIRNGRGEVVEIWPLSAKRVKVTRENGQLTYTYQEASDNGLGSKSIPIPRSSMMHIPGLGFNGLKGFSPIDMARNAIGIAVACEEYAAGFFSNGASPGGVLEHPGTVKDAKKLRDSWNALFQGSKNSHKVAVLEEGMKYQAIGISPEQAQFLETRKFQINEIARIFRVPPHMVGDLEKSSFSNIEQMSLEFVKYTLDPWIVRIEQSINKELLRDDEKGIFAKLNVDGLLRGDYASRMQGYSIGRQNGWLSANDIREKEDENRIPAELGGDDYLINGNMLPISQAGAFANKS